LEDEIVLLRKELTEYGCDGGARTIHWHLSQRHDQVPSISTIWRVLKRRGFVVPQPQKRPRNSFIRFESALPNETWQGDITHWRLSDGTEVDILDFIDDYSRAIVCAEVYVSAKAPDVTHSFHKAAVLWGYPASVLTDNGAVFNARQRKGRTTLETELIKLGINYKHSRPYHPQTCGKIERWHQTLKQHLRRLIRASSIDELQQQVDNFVRHYNEARPHTARKTTPKLAFDSRDKAVPGDAVPNPHFRVRRDIVRDGRVSLRHNSKMHHIGLGKAFTGQRVTMLIVDLQIRVITDQGELIRQLTLDPSKDYQPSGG
jgi:transposase InsO family protein